MNDYDYENFYEPSEFDMMVEDFKDELRKSVSKKWVDRMNALEEENKSLQEIKKNFALIKKEYEEKKWQCEREKETALANAKREAQKARLSELLGDTQLNYWCITTERIQKPKCDKCDSNRQIEYITPMGRKAREYCSCHDGGVRHIPKKLTMYEIKLRNTYDKKVDVWFVRKHEDDDDLFVNSSEYFGNKVIIDDDTNVSEISEDNKYDLWFKTIEKCQEYCDYLNSLRETK